MVVGILHVDAGALMNCAKYRRKTVEGLFSNTMKKKKCAKYKIIRGRSVTSLLLI